MKNQIELPAKDLHLPPPFKANAERIDCPLPLVKRYNPINVADYCHSWCFRDELCHHAPYCSPYIALILQRSNASKQLNVNILTKMGIKV